MRRGAPTIKAGFRSEISQKFNASSHRHRIYSATRTFNCRSQVTVVGDPEDVASQVSVSKPDNSLWAATTVKISYLAAAVVFVALPALAQQPRWSTDPVNGSRAWNVLSNSPKNWLGKRPSGSAERRRHSMVRGCYAHRYWLQRTSEQFSK